MIVVIVAADAGAAGAVVGAGCAGVVVGGVGSGAGGVAADSARGTVQRGRDPGRSRWVPSSVPAVRESERRRA